MKSTEEDADLLRTGVLYVVEEGTELTNGMTSISTALVLNSLTRLVTAFNRANEKSLKATFESLFYDTKGHLLSPNFSILNSKGGKLVKVGTVSEGVVTMNGEEVVFPGGVTTAPNLAKLPIYFTAALTGLEPNGSVAYLAPAV
ncbi:MAG: hypothetical protein V2I33_24180 [Kangiellaceae bacterium]|nr:hypothetical protein [Kangiellaceae bacterium]